MGTMEKEYMNLNEVAQFLKLSVPTIKNYLRDKRIPAYKIGGKWLFEKNEINEWVSSQRQSVNLSVASR
jgi:excisionase family DNA binding protein